MCADTSSLVVVLIGPGGVGKGTIASRLVQEDERLRLSRSWTTRPPRSGESGEEYVFVERERFESAIDDGYFLEWAQFQGNLYGTPRPEPDAEDDVLLEIEVQGAEQVRREHPEAVIFLILAPSDEELERRLRFRGDRDEHVMRRLASTPEEIARGRELADHVILNDDVERATREILSILEGLRGSSRTPSTKEDTHG